MRLFPFLFLFECVRCNTSICDNVSLAIPGSIITSPNYPSTYDGGITCSKVIKTPSATVIIKSSIDLDCNYDLLQIKTNVSVIDLCNDNADSIVVEGDFEIVFKSDEIVDGPKTGFELLLSTQSYESVLCASICYCWGSFGKFNLGCKFSKSTLAKIVSEVNVSNISSLSLRVDTVDDLSSVSNFAKFNIESMELFFNSSSFIIPPNYFSNFNQTLTSLVLTGHPTARIKTVIDDFDVDAFRGLDRLKSISLQYLKCEMNQLSMMKAGSRHPLVNVQKLLFRHIDMSDDIIQSGFFSPLVGLTHLRIENANVDFSNVNLTSLDSLEHLELVFVSAGGSLPTDLIRNKPNLELLRLVGFNNPEVKWAEIFSAGCPENLKKLFLEMGQIRHLDLKAKCKQLETMSLKLNALENIKISGFPKLKNLLLQLNQLESITVDGPTVIQEIDLSHNPELEVTSINSLINNSPDLVHLTLDNINFGRVLPNLTSVCPTGSLSMNMCNVRKIPDNYFDKCSDLKYLSLDGNDHISFAESSLTGLLSVRRIDCLYCNKHGGIHLTKLDTGPMSFAPDAEISVHSFSNPEEMVWELSHSTKMAQNETEEIAEPLPTTVTQTETTIDWSELDFEDDTTEAAPAIKPELVTVEETTVPQEQTTVVKKENHISSSNPPVEVTDAVVHNLQATEENSVQTESAEFEPEMEVNTPKAEPEEFHSIFESVLIFLGLIITLGVMVHLLYRTDRKSVV